MLTANRCHGAGIKRMPIVLNGVHIPAAARKQMMMVVDVELSPKRPELVIAYYAVLAAGGVVTTVNPMATGAELAGQLRSSGARWMVTTPELFERDACDAAAAAQLREVFLFEELLNFVADRVSPHKRMRIVEFIDEIPALIASAR